MDRVENQIKRGSNHFMEVMKYLELLGCTTLADIDHVGYPDLMLEFHTTFVKKDDYFGFRCRLGGIPIEASEDEFDNIFGLDFEGTAITTTMEGYNGDKMWVDLTGVGQNGEKCIKASTMTNEALLVAYKFLAYVVFARDEASKMNRTERRIIWCIMNGNKPCLIPAIIQAMDATYTTKGGLVGFGHYITALTKNVGIDITGCAQLAFRTFNIDARPSPSPKKGQPTHKGETSGIQTDAGPSTSTFPSTQLPDPTEDGPFMGWDQFFKNQQHICNLIGALNTSVDARFDEFGRRLDKADANTDELQIKFINFNRRNEVEHHKTRALIRTRFDLPVENEPGDGNPIYEDEDDPMGPEGAFPEMSMNMEGLGGGGNFERGVADEEARLYKDVNVDANKDEAMEGNENDDDDGFEDYGDE